MAEATFRQHRTPLFFSRLASLRMGWALTDALKAELTGISSVAAALRSLSRPDSPALCCGSGSSLPLKAGQARRKGLMK